jgi:hypothetical protein
LSTAATAAWICLSSSDEGSAPGTIRYACKRKGEIESTTQHLSECNGGPGALYTIAKITFKIQNNVHALGVVASEERDESTHVLSYYRGSNVRSSWKLMIEAETVRREVKKNGFRVDSLARNSRLTSAGDSRKLVDSNRK